VKPGSTFVLGETDPLLADVFAATPASAIWKRDVDFACTSSTVAVGGRLVDLRTPGGVYEEVFLPLHGEHQAHNAAVAVAAVEAFFDRPLDPAVVAEALGSVRTPGRFEVVGHEPLVVLDGAHNPDGASAAAATLAEGFQIAGDLRLVVGVLGGRDPEELLQRLGAAEAREVVCCSPDSPRALPVEDLAAAVVAVGGTPRAAASVDDAVRSAVAASSESDAVLVTGSLYTVGAARTACRSIEGLTVT
jgi:dihydrofolate synthase/folylpolyglutamate synthase